MTTITVIDIGAHGGASKHWSKISEYVEIIGFDPNDEECKKQNSQAASNEKFYPYAIAGESAKRDFYVTKSATCSSLIKPNHLEFEKYGEPGTLRNTRSDIAQTLEVDCISLSDFCTRESIQPDFIKLDTQGSEFEILQGYNAELNSVIGLEIEVEFVELYSGQPLFSEIELYLRGKGFELFGLARHMWKMHNGTDCSLLSGGRLTFADALFFHSSIFDTNISKDKAKKATLLACRYKLFDLAERLLSLHNLENDSSITGFLSEQYTWQEKLQKRINQWFNRSHKGKGELVDFDGRFGF